MAVEFPNRNLSQQCTYSVVYLKNDTTAHICQLTSTLHLIRTSKLTLKSTPTQGTTKTMTPSHSIHIQIHTLTQKSTMPPKGRTSKTPTPQHVNLPTKTKKEQIANQRRVMNRSTLASAIHRGRQHLVTMKLLLIKITIKIQDVVALQNRRRVIVRSGLMSSFHQGGQHKLVTTKLITLRVLWNLRQIIHPAPMLAFRPGKQRLLMITTLLQSPLQKLILPL